MSTPGRKSEQNESVNTALAPWREPLRRFFARRMRAGADVEDLVQDVFCRLLNRGGLSGVSQVEAYIFQTANNVLRDYLRRRVTHAADRHDGDAGEVCAEDASPERVLMGKEAVGQFARALFELPERTRTIFILSRVNRLDYRTISRMQAISVSAVEKHVAKALSHLVLRMKA